MEEAKAKAIADFNSKKAQELANINEEGKAKRAELEKTTAKAHELETEITELENLSLIHICFECEASSLTMPYLDLVDMHPMTAVSYTHLLASSGSSWNPSGRYGATV